MARTKYFIQVQGARDGGVVFLTWPIDGFQDWLDQSWTTTIYNTVKLIWSCGNKLQSELQLVVATSHLDSSLSLPEKPLTWAASNSSLLGGPSFKMPALNRSVWFLGKTW